jgi:hypothetical protein
MIPLNCYGVASLLSKTVELGGTLRLQVGNLLRLKASYNAPLEDETP